MKLKITIKLILFGFLLMSCGDDDEPNETPTPTKPVVYAGFVDFSGVSDVAKIWKDGVEVSLTLLNNKLLLNKFLNDV